MTSIQSFWNKIALKLSVDQINDFLPLFEQAKEIHKGEIINAWNNGDFGYYRTAEQHYQETFVSKRTDDKDVVLGYKTSLDAQILDSQLPKTEHNSQTFKK